MLYPVLLFLLAVGSLCAQETVTFHSDAHFIAVDVQVLSHDKPFLGLKQKDFLVWDEGQLQTVTNFGPEDQPLDIMLLLDVSASTTLIQMTIKFDARRALEQLRFRDRVGVIVFDEKARVVIAPTSDWLAVHQAIVNIFWGKPLTEINVPVFQTAQYLRRHARADARRAIVILTDNKGSRSVADSSVISELWEADVVFDGLLYAPTLGPRGDADTKRFASATGGEVLKATAKEIPFAEIFRRLRERYVLLYRVPGGEPGSIRRITVDLTPEAKPGLRGLKIRARAGYRVGQPGSEARRPLQRR